MGGREGGRKEGEGEGEGGRQRLPAGERLIEAVARRQWANGYEAEWLLKGARAWGGLARVGSGGDPGGGTRGNTNAILTFRCRANVAHKEDSQARFWPWLSGKRLVQNLTLAFR